MIMLGGLEWIVVLLIIGVPAILLILLLILAARGRNQPPQPQTENMPNLVQRTDTLRKKQDRSSYRRP